MPKMTKQDQMEQAQTNDNSDGQCLNLSESISLANDALEKAIETNDIEYAIDLLEPYSNRSLFHSSLKSIILILQAGLTLNKDDLERATKSTDQTAKLSNKYRRNGFIDSLKKLFRTPNYDKYTDIELHAELTYAKFLGMSAILCGLEATNIYSLIKIAYRLRLCVSAFKECRTILRLRTNWESETSKQHFEAGVRLANGIQHLTISHIPPKLLRIVNFLGYKGVESRAFEELGKAAFELPGISSRIAQVVLLYYWVVAQPHACLGAKDLTLSKQIVDNELKRFPKSLLYRLPKAKMEQISGRIDEAIDGFKDCLFGNKLTITHKIFNIELAFCYALKGEWTESIKYAALVREQALHHSATVVTFIEAVFRYAKSVDDNDPEQKQIATELFKAIPSMRIRYFGKTITPEKIAVEVALKYIRNNETLVLPEMEILYSSNFLYFIKNNEKLLNLHLKRVQKWVDFYEKDLTNCDFIDNYLTALFFKGVLLKLLGRYKEAKECFHTVLNEESRIEREFSIPPQSVLELGIIELYENNEEEAHHWLTKAIKDYSGYLHENYVHLRSYAALRELGISTDKHSEENPHKISEYGKEWLKDLEIEENSYENIMKKDILVLK